MKNTVNNKAKTLTTSLNKMQDDGFYELTHGIDVDQFLFREEIQVQQAWVVGLEECNILSSQEKQSLLSTLQSIEFEMQEGTFAWVKEDEDIHMNIERAVTQRLGELGKKMHLGRSRNDLIATTLKLYLAKICIDLSKETNEIAKTIIGLAERDVDLIVPAYTHSQAAQPVRMAHIWNFHALNFLNDTKRLKNCRKETLKTMPLGAAAIAGTHLEIDLASVAKNLGFDFPPLNSVHAVSDRDNVLEVGHCMSMLGLHISRLCEEVIFLSASPVGMLQLSSDWSSGSSIMPNKRNPDFFEVVRAKSKKMIGISMELMVLNSGIASGYSSDFHEQKRRLVQSIQDLQTMLPIFRIAISSLKLNSSRAAELLMQGHILATDVANKMVSQGIYFRDAYTKVADEVAEINKRNVDWVKCIDTLASQQIGAKDISYCSAVESRSNSGGTSRARVIESIELLRSELGVDQNAY